MDGAALTYALSDTPAGGWGVGVSGGADSVALLLLAHANPNLSLHVIHLDHETRGADSTADATFVLGLARRLSLPASIATRTQVEAQHIDVSRDDDDSPEPDQFGANLSARFRQLRHALFKQAAAEHRLQGILLAHHADDQAETVFHRLLRGSGPAGLAGMAVESHIGDLRLRRPLLHIPRQDLRDYLTGIGQPWREDASNASDKYERNRLRKILASAPDLTQCLLQLGERCRDLRDWTRANAPQLDIELNCKQLAALPDILAEESARAWLIARNVPAEEISPAVIDRLLTMARDAGSPTSADFPGGVRLRRRQGRIGAS